jgi:hypothetical protein
MTTGQANRDFFEAIEKIIASAEEDELVLVNVVWLRALLDLAKKAPRSRRGRKALSGREEMMDWLDARRAKTIKARLLSEAASAGKKLSSDRAARQAADVVSKKHSRLSEDALLRRMERKSGRLK